MGQIVEVNSMEVNKVVGILACCTGPECNVAVTPDIFGVR